MSKRHQASFAISIEGVVCVCGGGDNHDRALGIFYQKVDLRKKKKKKKNGKDATPSLFLPAYNN